MNPEQFWAAEFRRAVDALRGDDAVKTNGQVLEEATRWADRALAEYDKRFPST